MIFIPQIISLPCPPSFGLPRKILTEKLLKLPRFSQRFVDDGKAVSLIDVPVDMLYHVQEVFQDVPWSAAEFDSWLSGFNTAEKGLDVERPLWQVTCGLTHTYPFLTRTPFLSVR